MEGSHSDHEVSAFLLRACHDLKASVRTIRTQSELFLLEAGALQATAAAGEDSQQRFHFILDGVRTFDSVVDGMTRYSMALQTGATPFAPVRMEALVRAAIRKLTKEISESGGKSYMANSHNSPVTAIACPRCSKTCSQTG